ncbi:MAG: HDIG domain-containing protein [Spirochaetaceae bacterium]|jgi:putative nucleotidyltransferase with HDIG domain|nr:HDIG domain-containing protein [Spirochaetaceae bacterium]
MKKKNNNNEEYNSLFIKISGQIKEAAKTPGIAIASFMAFLIIVIPALIAEKSLFVLTGNIGLYLLLFYLFFICLCGYKSTGKRLKVGETYLLISLTALYFIAAHFIDNNAFFNGAMPISVVMPTSLIVMLVSIMVSTPHARIMGILFPLGAFLIHSFDRYALIFALTSGIASSFVLQNAKKRIDMAKAGAIVAIVHTITISALLLSRKMPWMFYSTILFFSAINGIASGMLVLGITPVFENMLHSATAFRLIELLDLGAPMMRLLASKTPGTYNHSLIVANLAEAACQEIGARSLLARVGAYYHDIGKIDQPDYFVENQKMENKHDDINPRLSATVIRSHVKLGVEKGHAIGLPNEVIDIIASHHGNSLIAYFYYEALKKEEHVEMEDFCYPGHPPQTKEAAVVMLADVTEAAVRTLDKPSTSRLEKFINELITKKIDSAQLSQSELTFRELETIKKIFVRVITSYYHTRIEYPNQTKDSAKDDE